jgi:predicted lipoprotein
MAASEEVGRASARPGLVGAKRGGLKSVLLFGVLAAVLLYFFPLFRIVPLNPPATATAANVAPAAFDPRIAAEKIWKGELAAAASRATELKQIVAMVRANPETAKAQFAKSAGMGAAYFFTRGSGKVVSRERNHVHVAVEGAPNEIIAVRLGPVFGNTVRDGCGLLDVNAFPGLQEFNALSAELNALVEKNVLPALREKAVVGATIRFAGCAEAPESSADAGEPLFMLVPVQAEIR